MSIDIDSFFNHAFHIRPAQLKHAPFVKPGQEVRAAHQINAVTAPLAHAVAQGADPRAIGPIGVFVGQLAHIQEITDHQAAAEFVTKHMQEAAAKPKG